MALDSSVAFTLAGPMFRVDIDAAAGVIAPEGELDVRTSEGLRTAGAIVLAGEARPITITLDGLYFLDAAGLGVLVELRNAALAAGRTLSLSNPSARVLKVFRCGGLEHLLNPEQSPAAAASRLPDGAGDMQP